MKNKGRFYFILNRNYNYIINTLNDLILYGLGQTSENRGFV
jgi:hypothetical protein